MTNQLFSWPGWEIVRRIGKGGFGAVYEIKRDVYGRQEKAALKVITIPHDEDEVDYLRCTGLTDDNITQSLHKQVADIAREYNLMAEMRENPNVVRCDDFKDIQHDDKLGWDIYIKMELLAPLMKCLDKVQAEEQVIKLGMDICNALVACQDKDIIHRDIKPQNIFLSDKGQFKLGDFGIARTAERTTRATAGIGTYSYMAPEVEKSEPYGKTVDIYSLGLVLYWLLNERRGPFLPLPPVVPGYAEEQEARIRRLHGEPIPAPKNGSEALKAIVLKACAYDPKDRYQSAQEMMDALTALKTGAAPVVEPVIEKPSNDPAPAIDTVEDDILTVGPGWSNVKEEPAADDVTVGPGWAVPVEDDVTVGPGTYGILEIEDDVTVGPTWKNKPAETNTDITVGPVFVKASASADVPKKPEVSKKMSPALLGAAAAAIVILVLLISLIGGNTKNNQVPAASAPSNQQAAVSNQSAQNSVCSHVWNNATCTQPKTCRDCGETQGAAAGHSWVDATRLSPKTCSVCGATEGTALAPPNISVDSQVQQIADEYYAIEDALNNGDLNRKDVRSGVYYYYDKYGNIRSVVTAKGNDGLGSYSDQYRRYYYFANGELIFAFFEGQDFHRLYFYKGQLMRWRYQGVGQSKAGAVNEDFTYSDDFLKWESLALKEVAGFGVI